MTRLKWLHRPSSTRPIIHPDDELKILELMTKIVIEGSEPSAVEFRMRANDGTYHWMECHYTPIRDATRRLVEIEGILADITEKKEAADKISYPCQDRCPYWARQPRDLHRPAAPVIRRGQAWRESLRGSLSRSRPVQGRQRHARAFCRRFVAQGGGRAPQGLYPRDRSRRPSGRRRVRYPTSRF